MASFGDERTRAYAVLLFMPLFFSSNIVFGRAAVVEVEPWTLAFLRWSLTALILVPIAWKGLRVHWRLLLSQWETIGILGVLGMWICGALVYLALRHTSATNGTLIYASTPVVVILLEAIFRGRRISAREAFGVPLALAGVVAIVVEGSLEQLMALQFNWGDILFAICTLCWAIYSVVLKRPVFASVPTLSLFAAIAVAGALSLLPFTIWEIALVNDFPTSGSAWRSVATIVAFASLLAFGTYQYGVKVVGPSVTAVFMYLLPVYGVTLAIIFLGEQLQMFHVTGSLLVMGGVVLATFPIDLIRRSGRARQAANNSE